jgi:hypothetical protein
MALMNKTYATFTLFNNDRLILKTAMSFSVCIQLFKYCALTFRFISGGDSRRCFNRIIFEVPSVHCKLNGYIVFWNGWRKHIRIVTCLSDYTRVLDR